MRIVMVEADIAAMAVDRDGGVLYLSTGCSVDDAVRLAVQVLTPAELAPLYLVSEDRLEHVG